MHCARFSAIEAKSKVCTHRTHTGFEKNPSSFIVFCTAANAISPVKAPVHDEELLLLERIMLSSRQASYRKWPSMARKPYEFIGEVDIHGPNSEAIGKLTIYGPKSYEFIGDFAIHGPDPLFAWL